jgi:hypothetical protein
MNMQIKTLPGFSKGAIKRAQTATDIILFNPSEIGYRKYDRCFEMYDGKDVGLLIMHTLKSHNVGFDQLPRRIQEYFGLKFWKRLEEEYNIHIQMQVTLTF